MKYQSVVLFVQDIEQTKQFYQNFLSLEITHDFGKNIIFEGGIAIWEIADGHIISKKNNIKGDTKKIELYFEHDNLNEIETKLYENRITFSHKTEEESWGQRTIRLYDLDNNIIEIGEPLEISVRRLGNNGLSHYAISEKTGININIVNQMIES